MTTLSLTQKGLAAARFVRALAIAKGDLMGARAYAEGQDWHATPAVAAALRGLVEANDTNDAAALMGPVGLDFADYLRPLSILGRISGARRVPFQTRLVGQKEGAVASWAGQGAAKPISSAEFADELDQLTSAKVVATVVITTELARLSTPAAEQALLSDLGRAAAAAIDTAFADPSNGGDADTPAAVTHGAPSFSSSGATLAAIDADLQKLIASLTATGSNLTAAHWIMPPTTASSLASARGTGGAAAFPLINARGGSLLGLPVVTSGSAPADSIILLDADGILLADDGQASFEIARQASLDMSDDPAGGAVQQISLWQLGLAALRAERWINWRTRRDAVAAVLTGVEY